MSPACQEALELVLRLVAAGVRPQIKAISAHYHIDQRRLILGLREHGWRPQNGRFTPAQNEAHRRAAPHIEILADVRQRETTEDETGPARPPAAELLDTCARWGFAGAAEEYEVSEHQICKWLRQQGEEGEVASRAKGNGQGAERPDRASNKKSNFSA
jgi:hypothetical protein